ncbi:hypothetical protein CEUSTIGMA_g7460.t1 [Chlamydomonas eustigma]|uniref:TATA box binding protein associated factor (TAF) histone-like fold domain-containing protein n=1 Tax=Chlamydomonas eustigma TaxID=1157962 RepID=A0A250XAA8_9CHLO|nr:hypothetical protein CEUSTIGMA_g7460.t1 [Chlamydomonas eustigma]|eukprot:GAX80021.1 hypothetical protein CEUSTIGMA_g7460.t1 [Chlamydomonas eustigma]
MEHAIISHSSIEAIAESIDIKKLSVEAAKALSPDVDYRLREIIQDAQKFARHARRTRITTEDVNDAVRLRNFEPLYGFSNKDAAKYTRATGHPDMCVVKDPILPLDKLLEQPLPRPPVEVGLMPHWLFINGIQPIIPENAPLEKPVSRQPKRPATVLLPGGAIKRPTNAEFTAAAASQPAAVSLPVAQVQPPVQHSLSKELQLYFDKVVVLLKGQSLLSSSGPTAAAAAAGGQPGIEGSVPSTRGNLSSATSPEMNRQQRAAFESISNDPGLHPLTPYFVKYVVDEVACNLKNLQILRTMLQLATAIISNPHIQLEHYIHQLLPPVLTCLVAKSLGSNPSDDHWSVRDAAAVIIKQVCVRFSDPFFNVQPRISKTLLKSFLDSNKPLATHYGAVIGLAALGHATVSHLLIPHLYNYMLRLRPFLEGSPVSKVLESQKVAGQVSSRSSTVTAGLQVLGSQRVDAYRVHGAMLDAVSSAVNERKVAASMLCNATQDRRHKRIPAWTDEVASITAVGDSGGGNCDADRQEKDYGDVVMRDVEVPTVSWQAGVILDTAVNRKRGRGTGSGTGMNGDVTAVSPTVEERIQSILAGSWREEADVQREEADLEKIYWALEQIFGESFTARIPTPYPSFLNL